MVAVRILNQKKYDNRRGRFRSEAFEPTSDGPTDTPGISIIDAECVKNTSKKGNVNMVAVRILNQKKYDNRRGRFRSEAFEPTSDGPTDTPGISIIDAECVKNTSDNICAHIAEFYASTAGTPIIFWKFATQILPPEHCIKQKDSITGDKCHNNIHNLSKTQARNFFVKGDEYARKIHLFCICTETGIRRLAEDDLNQN